LDGFLSFGRPGAFWVAAVHYTGLPAEAGASLLSVTPRESPDHRLFPLLWHKKVLRGSQKHGRGAEQRREVLSERSVPPKSISPYRKEIEERFQGFF